MSRRNVCLIQQEEPEFIRKLKCQIGYKEEKVDIQDKFKIDDDDTKARPKAPFDADSDDDDDEECKPQVVIPESSGLTEEDIKKFKPKDDEEEPADGRMIYRKQKRKTEDEKGSDKPSKKRSLDKPKASTAIKRNLLSFDIDE